MSDRPERNLWHPPANPGAWRAISKPTIKRRKLTVRPTLPASVPRIAKTTGGWHLPALSETTARPAPKTASPEELALGLADVSPAPEEVTPAPEEVAEEKTPDPLRPEDMTYDASSDDAGNRPEDIAAEVESEEEAPLRPEDLALMTETEDEISEDEFAAALDVLDDDDDDAFTMSELLALQSLADDSAGSDAEQGEELSLDVVPTADEAEIDMDALSPAERAALSTTQEAEIEPDTGEVSADQFDYASQLAALEGGADDAYAPPAATADPSSDPQSYAQQQLAALQGDASDPYGDTQSLQNTPAMPSPAIDPQQEAFAQRFVDVENQVRELRAQRDSRMISPEQFESALRELMIFDENEGVYWMLGADTEIWYKYDNAQNQWVVATPPRPAGTQSPPTPYGQYQHAVPTETSNVEPVGGGLPRVGQDASDEWGYSQPSDPFGANDSYQMPQPVPPRDEQATMVGSAAFKDQLTTAEPTVVNQNVVGDDQGYVAVEAATDFGDDFDDPYQEDLSAQVEMAQRRQQRQLITTLGTIAAVIFGLALLVFAGLGFYVYSQYQGIKSQWDAEIANFGGFETSFQTVVIQDINGNEIARLRSEQGGDRTNVDLEDIDPFMIHAVVSTENERFFTDSGWDPIALTRAFLSNLVAGEIVSGGSTITQQVARNIILRDSERVFSNEAQRKLHEIVVSHELAQRYGKNDILEVYLNEVYFGNLQYGVEAAAEFYFGTPANDLNLAEAALLAGLIQAPAASDPVTQPIAAFNRLDDVVRLMTQAGGGSGCLPIPFQSQPFCVTEQTLEGEAATHIAIVKTTVYLPQRSTIDHPHFVTFVQQQLQQQFTQEEIFQRGFVVRTTMRQDMQDQAQNALENYVNSIGTTGVNTGTVMVTNPDSGAILAMIGSPDFNNESIDGQVNLALSWQQPGSAIKPITYTAALEGVVTETGPAYYTPATILWDVPTTYGDAANTVITNFDNEYHGPRSVRNALQNSYNVPAVKAYRFIGTPNFQQTAQAMGLRFLPEAEFGLPTGVGATEIRLYDMMEAYGTISNDGTLVPLYAIEEITDAAGNPVEWERAAPSQAIQPATAFLMQNILSDNQARTEEFGANNRLFFNQFPDQVAAKTGTSNDGRDLWTMGFTDDLVVGVWLGHVDNNPTFNTSGYQTASPLWRTVMENAINTTRPPSAWNVPAGIIQAQYCATTGTQVDPSGAIPCNDVRTGFFINGQLPPPPTDGFVRLAQINTWNGLLANNFCPDDVQTIAVANIDDPTAVAWLRDNPVGQQVAQQLGFTEGLVSAPQTACDQSTQILQAGINSPTANQVVTTNIIPINGSITSAANFSSYDIQVAPASSPDTFQIVDGPYQTLPVGQQLGQWDATNASDGQYILRLAINNNQGGFAYRTVTFTLDKPEPTATPTPPPIPTAPPLGGGIGGQPGVATPTLLPFDGGSTFGATPTATIDFGG
jgi:membrane peptidoglycan carboxypeptidase